MFKVKPFFEFLIAAKCLSFLALAVCLVGCRDNPAQSKQVAFFDAPAGAQKFFPRSEPESVGVDTAALATLVAEAQNTHSSALIVVKDGHVIAERYFGSTAKEPLRINSVTKSVVSLAMGQLIADNKIPSLGTPLSKWFPEWVLGKKAKVTLRDILTHTSGLYHEESAAGLYQQPDVVRYARGLPIADEPGKNFSYSNEAVALIPAIVQAASGKPLDKYLQERIFKPLGIVDYKWDRDAAGNPLAFGGLWLFPRDLARLGQLMLDSGRCNGKQLVPAAWVRACTSPARADIPDYGLFWRLYHDRTNSPPKVAGFGGDGWLGQYVVVYPEQHLVAVRLHAVESGNDERENQKYGFSAFRELVSSLTLPPSTSGEDKFKVEVY